ncbi:MAG TPA: hypothetical protein VGG08_06290 [Solirubrobacteraceae bacterium]|jgi:hypothetical protein
MASVGMAGSRRDAVLRRLKRTNRLLLAGSVALSALLAGAAAETFKGRNEEHRAAQRKRVTSPAGQRVTRLRGASQQPVSPRQEEELATLERERREPPVISGAS